ncbi:MAG: Eco57I restriction-modification methylase domain-containing protein [Gemmatimonadota bacterium]
MRNDIPAIRQILADTFAARSPTSLLELFGFTDAAVHLDDLEQDVSYHGSRGTLACYVVHAAPEPAPVARQLRTRNLAQLQLYLFVRGDYSEMIVGSFGLGDRLLTLTLQRDHIHASDLETLLEMMPAADERGSALAARHARALDRSRVTRRFFSDFAAQRDAVAAAWNGLLPQQRRDREQLALLLLSRLMFLYFLQHRGYLAGNRAYLVQHFRQWRSAKQTFYAGALKPLFFFVLNRRPEQRPARASVFGDLPYLNGGLFERHALERKHARLDLPDAALKSVFDDLLERYRFTAREASDAEIDGMHDVGVDPEMLGGVFEGLMAERVRETTGTFYTPAATVDRLVCNTLAAYAQPGSAARLLREVKVLDPACGSGAFLLGALARIAERRAATEQRDLMQLRRETVARSLYGVDLQRDAARLCALRLWLALVPGEDSGEVQPLPNLDRQIRQGDSLVDPLDLRIGAASSEVRKCIAELQPAATAYVVSEPEQRPALQQSLLRNERRLARAWVDTQQRRLDYTTSELHAATQQKDLFGAITSEARAARAQLADVRARTSELRSVARAIRTRNEQPFFSFAVHFPDAAIQGFDIVLCNPPWVRSHNWPRTLPDVVRNRYTVCRGATWQPPHAGAIASGGGHQIDLAMLFLERALDLLAPGGALGIILPAKFMRSLSGASARKLLLEQTDIVSIEDHSLDQRSIFHADAFAALIVARKPDSAARAPAVVQARMVRRNASPLKFAIAQNDLPFVAGDARAPWLIAPADVRRALNRMRASPMIGAYPELKPRRGLVSGANAVMLLTRADPKLGGLASIQSEGARDSARSADFEGMVEQSAVARVVRGSDIRPWAFRRERFLLCRSPGASANLPRLSAYLRKHRLTIADTPKRDTAASCVAWHDLASTLNAVVLPAEIVAINTVYFISAADDVAHLLSAYFNSLPVRAFARAIAERAKDAHFRFFAWTVSMLPLPLAWRSFECRHLHDISQAAHARGSIDDDAQAELDEIVARAYGLSRADLRHLRDFDKWLRGQ